MISTFELSNIVSRYPDLLSNATSLTNTLNNQNITIKNNKLISLGDLIDAVGSTDASIGIAVLKAVATSGDPSALIYERAIGKFDGQGLNFADQNTQDLIESIRPLFEAQKPGLTDTLKAVGIYNISLIEQEFGKGSSINSVEVQAAIDMYNLRAWHQNISNTVLSQINDGTLTSKLAIQALYI